MSSENKPVALVKETCAGPRLLVYGVKAQSWLGTFYNQDAHQLAAEINAAAHPAPSEPSEAMVDAMRTAVREIQRAQSEHDMADAYLSEHIDAALAALLAAMAEGAGR